VKIKVAIAQTQGHIADSHFGESDALLFYTIDTATGESVFEGSKENPIKKLDEQGHGSQEKLLAAAEVLEDRQVVVSGQPSPNFKKLKEKYGKIPVVVRSTDDVEQILAKLTAYFKQVRSLSKAAFAPGSYILL